MEKVYTCECGGKKWIVNNQGVICYDCGNKYAVVYRAFESGQWQDIFISLDEFKDSRKFVRKLTKEEIEDLIS